jgi:hypothetical protein
MFDREIRTRIRAPPEAHSAIPTWPAGCAPNAAPTRLLPAAESAALARRMRESPGDNALIARSGEPVQHLPEPDDRRRNRHCQTINGQCQWNGSNLTRLPSGLFQF